MNTILRLTKRSEHLVMEAFGNIETFQAYLNEHSAWMFQQKYQQKLNGKTINNSPSIILLCGNLKLILSIPIIDHNPEGLYYYNRIITIQNPTRYDREDALTGREIKDPIEVQNNTADNLNYPRDITTPTQPLTPAPAPTLDPQTILHEKTQPLTITPAQKLLNSIQQGATAYFCPRTSDVIATHKPGAPCETCKQPTTPNTHPPISKILKRGKANTLYYCETTSCLIVGDETPRYCELCGKPNKTHKLTHLTTQTLQPPTEATTTTPKETENKQPLVTPKCPLCSTNLAPSRGLYCPHCNHKLPPELAVHPEVVVAIKRDAYNQLATHLKQSTNIAWNRLLKGRKVDKTINSMGQNLFIITVQDENCTSTLTDEQKLDSILTDIGIGRLTADPYELKEARRMMDQKPQPA